MTSPEVLSASMSAGAAAVSAFVPTASTFGSKSVRLLAMSNHPPTWPTPARIGVDALDLLKGTISLIRDEVGHLVRASGDEEAIETVQLSYRGVAYELNLTERTAASLDRAIAPYLNAGRRVAEAGPSPGSTRKSGPQPPPPGDVRAWARSQGIEVSDRGRLSVEVNRRYKDAHGG